MAASRMILSRTLRSMLIACAVCLASPIAHAWTPRAEPGLSSTPLGGEPQAIAISDTARLAAVALRDAQAVAFVDIDSGGVLGQVSLNRKPTALVFNAAGTRAYVLSDDSNKLAVIDVATRSVLATWTIGNEPSALAFDPAQSQLVVADADQRELRALDPATGSQLRILALDFSPRQLVFSANGQRLIVGGKGLLVSLDAASWSELRRLTVGDDIRSLAWWDFGALALAVGKKQDALNLINAETGAITARIPLDGEPDAVALSQSEDRAFVSTREDLSVNRVELGPRTLTGRYPLPGRAGGVAFDPLTRVLLITQPKDDLLLKLDPAQASLIGGLTLNQRLRDIAINNVTHEAVAIADKSDALSRIKLSDRSAQVVPLPATPQYVQVDTGLNRAVVSLRKAREEIAFVDLSGATPRVYPERIDFADEIRAIAVDSTRALTVALTKGANRIHLVDNATRTVISSSPSSEKFETLAIHSGRGVAYLVAEDKKLLLLDLATRTLTQAISLTFKVDGIAVDEALDRAVLTTSNGDRAYVLDLASLTLSASFVLPRHPGEVAIQQETHLAVITSRESGALSLIDLQTLQAIASFSTQQKPNRLALSTRYNQAWVLSAERDEIAIVQLSNPAPVLNQIVPGQVSTGTPSMALIVHGAHFIDGAQVRFGTTALLTRWQSPALLFADVPAALLASLRSVSITVVHPGPGGSTSNALSFQVLGPAPSLTSIAPPALLASRGPQLITATGAHFVPGAQILFGSQSLITEYLSATQLRATVPGTLLTKPGSVQVSVVSPAGPSNSLSLPIGSPAPVIDSISPTSGALGSTATLTGRGFNALPANNTVAFGGGPQAQVLIPTGSMNTRRTDYTLTMLADGRVLAAGGWVSGNLTNTAEIYDPATERWTATGSMTVARSDHTATLLRNGKVLVAGGYNGLTVWEGSAEIYDPVTGAWTATGSLITARWVGAAAPLRDGRVLMSGGSTPTGSASSAEIYDPTTGRWTETGSMHAPRYYHQTVTLQDGRVLVTGGAGTDSAEIYDPASGAWSLTGSSPNGPSFYSTLTALSDGRVLIAGGQYSETRGAMYDPASGGWTLTPAIPNERGGDSATLLLDGTVFLAGASGPLLFNPVLQSWAVLSGPTFAFRSQAVRLLDGRVLVAGGSDCYQPVNSCTSVFFGVTQSFLFTGAPGTVVPVLTMQVTAPTALAVANGTYAGNPFTVSARVSNIGAGSATNVDVSVFLPDGLTLATGSFTQSIGDLAPGQHSDVVWTVHASGQKLDTTRTYFIRALSSNTAGQSATKQILLPGNALTVDSITPSAGGDTGSVTVHVNGGGIFDGAMVKLVRDGESDITATAVSVALDGFSVSATIDLTGKPRGFWSVLVTNPNGTSATLTNAFTVEAGRAAGVWGEIIGPSSITTGRPGTFFVEYGNRGNNNVYDVALFLRIPKNVSFSVRPLLPTATPPPPEVNVGVEEGAETLIPIWIYSVPAGTSGVLVLTLTPQIAGVLPIKAEILQPPVSQFSHTGDFAFTPFHVDLMAQVLAKALVPLVTLPKTSMLGQVGALSISTKAADICLDPDTCEAEIHDKLTKEAVRELRSAVDPVDVGIHIGFTFLAAAACVGVPISLPVCLAALGAEGAWASIEILAAGQATQRLLTARNAAVIPPPSPGGQSHDPNDKVGAHGVGQLGFVTGDVPLPYEILFENDATATAPAHEIVITDLLNAGALDLSTFSLGPISFGDRLIVPPVGLSQYTTDVDLRPASNLIVRINAGLDAATGVAAWHFVSLDPTTMLPPDDSQIGFLPPNVTSPEGQGSVLFTVNPKPNLSTGTEIRNRATIVFDANAPINTPEWFNTIDNDKPVSHVAPLPSTTTATDFGVQWAGSDVGSGILDYTVFVSENGGPFVPFVSNTTGTSAIFTGQAGRTYAFYSLARDQVGNAEDAKTAAEATTRIALGDTTPPTIESHADLSAEATGPDGALVTYVSPATHDAVDGDGTAICTPASGSTFPLGHTTVTCSATDAAGNHAVDSFFDVFVRDTTPPAVTNTSITLEAIGPQTAVKVPIPSASDLVDGPLQVTCTAPPTFPVGMAAVDCTATDAHHNTGHGTATVTVTDHTPPTIDPHADVPPVEATGPDGAVVTYVSPATHDAVDGSGVASCVPRAATTFPIGTTIVTCTAIDAAGNSATGKFNVTVRDVTTPGEMIGDGFIRNDDVRYDFNFHVQERMSDGERGSFQLRVQGNPRDSSRRQERDDRFVARAVTFVAFSDDPKVDTVVFFGQGEWNGTAGYSFRVFAMDLGEPGRHRDTIEITIWDPAGNVVVGVAGKLDGGNVQSKRIKH